MGNFVSVETNANVTALLTNKLSSNSTLRDAVRATVKGYFIKLAGVNPTNFYELFLTEIELPLWEMALQYTKNNQSEAAKILNLSRGTFRKKMQQYGLLKLREKK